MSNFTKTFFLGGHQPYPLHLNIGILLLRFFVGLALCTVFEKFFPKNGIWGPQAWFIQDTAHMGFPFPVFFAWVAVLSEFFGGILLMLGLFTRPAALLNVLVTFTATFIYHNGDIGGAGLLSFFFMIMCLCILLFGPGKFSLDHLLTKRLAKRWTSLSTIVLLFIGLQATAGEIKGPVMPPQTTSVSTATTPVRFYVRNNSLLPKRKTFIIYQPQQVGNNTLVKWLLPFQRISFELPVGSKMYLATNAQIDRVMQGQRIDEDKPFISVEESITHATVSLQAKTDE